MGNVSLKVLEKSLNFLFKNGYKPCVREWGPANDDPKRHGYYGIFLNGFLSIAKKMVNLLLSKTFSKQLILDKTRTPAACALEIYK